MQRLGHVVLLLALALLCVLHPYPVLADCTLQCYSIPLLATTGTAGNSSPCGPENSTSCTVVVSMQYDPCNATAALDAAVGPDQVLLSAFDPAQLQGASLACLEGGVLQLQSAGLYVLWGQSGSDCADVLASPAAAANATVRQFAAQIGTEFWANTAAQDAATALAGQDTQCPEPETTTDTSSVAVETTTATTTDTTTDGSSTTDTTTTTTTIHFGGYTTDTTTAGATSSSSSSTTTTDAADAADDDDDAGADGYYVKRSRKAVEPFVTCSQQLHNDWCCSVFGYRNPNDCDVTIDVEKDNNFFTPKPIDRGQTTEFLANTKVEEAFSVLWKCHRYEEHVLTWTLRHPAGKNAWPSGGPDADANAEDEDEDASADSWPHHHNSVEKFWKRSARAIRTRNDCNEAQREQWCQLA